ncbi:hypothetical protein ABW19_dt0210222 [Dactylella cylindrospora]|nr:hypothetical protein ABW19_dt0210222 [Dactylella cylindrospora]
METQIDKLRKEAARKIEKAFGWENVRWQSVKFESYATTGKNTYHWKQNENSEYHWDEKHAKTFKATIRSMRGTSTWFPQDCRDLRNLIEHELIIPVLNNPPEIEQFDDIIEDDGTSEVEKVHLPAAAFAEMTIKELGTELRRLQKEEEAMYDKLCARPQEEKSTPEWKDKFDLQYKRASKLAKIAKQLEKWRLPRLQTNTPAKKEEKKQIEDLRKERQLLNQKIGKYEKEMNDYKILLDRYKRGNGNREQGVTPPAPLPRHLDDVMQQCLNRVMHLREIASKQARSDLLEDTETVEAALNSLMGVFGVYCVNGAQGEENVLENAGKEGSEEENQKY